MKARLFDLSICEIGGVILFFCAELQAIIHRYLIEYVLVSFCCNIQRLADYLNFHGIPERYWNGDVLTAWQVPKR